MKRILAGLLLGGLTATTTGAVATYPADGSNLQSGTIFHPYWPNEHTNSSGLYRYGNGLHNASAATRGVTAAPALDSDFNLQQGVQVSLKIRDGSAATCTVYVMTDVGDSFSGYPMTKTTLGTTTTFSKGTLTVSPTSYQTISVYCEIPSGARIGALRIDY